MRPLTLKRNLRPDAHQDEGRYEMEVAETHHLLVFVSAALIGPFFWSWRRGLRMTVLRPSNRTAEGRRTGSAGSGPCAR